MNIKNSTKHFLGRHPDLFIPIYRMIGPGHAVRECLFSVTKEIVIEGFPRSANTFAVVAFRQAQNRNVPMAHHLHIEAQIIAGARQGLPVIVLVRNPVDAVRSLLLRHPSTGVNVAFRRYVCFYEAIKKIREKVVLAPFDDVISNFGSIIDKVNSKYGTNYRRFVHNEENVRKVYDEIESINRAFDNGEETHVARPSETRKALRSEVNIPCESPFFRRAINIFDSLMDAS